MNENPYAGGGDAQFDYYEEPQRTSLLAIFSLSSLLCCVPGIGLLGIVFGGLSFAFISASRGRLSGKGMAIAGLIVGIMVTTIQGAIFFGGLQVWTYYTKQMVPLADSTLKAAASGDLTTLQTKFVDGETITQAEMDRFVLIIEGEVGQVQEAYITFGDLVRVFSDTYSGRSSSTTIHTSPSGQDAAPAPFIVRGANGDLLAWAIFDESTTNTNNLLMFDLLVQLPGGLDSFSLRSSDIAREVSMGLGSQMLRADETPASLAPAPGTPDADAPPEQPASPVEEAAQPAEPPEEEG